jgi:hypothetical protein
MARVLPAADAGTGTGGPGRPIEAIDKRADREYP